MKSVKKSRLLLVVLSGALLISCNREGCMDSSALNYDAEATVDDGSCVYTEDVPQPRENHYYSLVSHNGDTLEQGSVPYLYGLAQSHMDFDNYVLSFYINDSLTNGVLVGGSCLINDDFTLVDSAVTGGVDLYSNRVGIQSYLTGGMTYTSHTGHVSIQDVEIHDFHPGDQDDINKRITLTLRFDGTFHTDSLETVPATLTMVFSN